MSSNEKNEKMMIQMNELFDELIEDANDFSKDMMFGVKMIPFAIGFFVLTTVGYTYYSFILTPNGLFNNIYEATVICLFLFLIYLYTKKYYELRRKYSTLFDLKEKLDNLEEL